MTLLLLDFGVVLVLKESKRETTLMKCCHSFRRGKVLQQPNWKWNVCMCNVLVDVFKLATVCAQLQVHYAKSQQYFINSQSTRHWQNLGFVDVFKLCSQYWCCIMLLLCFQSCELQKRCWMLSTFKKMCLLGQEAELVIAVLTRDDAFLVNTGSICGSTKAYSSVSCGIW